MFDSSSQDVGTQTLPVDIIYSVATKTSDIFSAGTDANVFLQLFGTQTASERIELKTSVNHRNKFERNHSDVFLLLNVPYFGEIREVLISHDNTGPSPSWHLNCVEVHESATDTIYTFVCGRWLATNEDDGQICRKLLCTSKRKKVPKHFRMIEENNFANQQNFIRWPLQQQQMMPQPRQIRPQAQHMRPKVMHQSQQIVPHGSMSPPPQFPPYPMGPYPHPLVPSPVARFSPTCGLSPNPTAFQKCE